MRTTITTRKDTTTLTIATSEELYLEHMAATDQRIKLTKGVNHIPVGAGVFLVRSNDPVTVTSDSADIHVAITGDKDGSIDPLVAAKNQPAPQ